MHEGAISRSDPHSLVAIDDLPQRPNQVVVGDDAWQAFADPGAGLWPGPAWRQPSGHVCLGNPGMMLGQDQPDRTADLSRQPGIDYAPPIEAQGWHWPGTIRRTSKPPFATHSTSGTRNEQRSASRPRTRRSKASRLAPAVVALGYCRGLVFSAA